MNIRIVVAGHKSYWMPEDPIYLPLQVGAALTDNHILNWTRDDQGENISEKNRTFCELTALYWAWKNLDANIIGLCHYRRYLGSSASLAFRLFTEKKKQFLNESQINMMLKDYDIILPKKRYYWIETRGSQYAHAHHIKDLQITEQILREKYPSYLPAWNNMLLSRSGHICNMFITRFDLFHEYCTWLFDILLEAEKRLDISTYSENDRRVFGFLGERLLDVWIETNRLRYAETPIINLESQHWLRKGAMFVQRKLQGKKKA